VAYRQKAFHHLLIRQMAGLMLLAQQTLQSVRFET
jgi:hypothetical protein